MGTVEGNLEALTQAILKEAREETDELRTRARAHADVIRKQAQEAAARERTALLDQANEEAQRLKSQATAAAQMKARALELEHREQLLQKVFRAVEDRLRSVPQRKDFEAIVKLLAREAISQVRADSVELLADSASREVLTQQALDALSKETGVKVTVGQLRDRGTGVIARTLDGRLQFDNTLETRLSRMQGAVRSAAYKILMGEAE